MSAVEDKKYMESPDLLNDLEAGHVALRQRRQAKWEAVSVSAAMLIVVAAAIFGLWETSKNSAYENFRHYLEGLAEAAATMVDPVQQDAIRRPEQLNDADYVRAVEPLRRLRHAVPDIHYVYTLALDGDVIHFVLDAADANAKNAGGQPRPIRGVGDLPATQSRDEARPRGGRGAGCRFLWYSHRDRRVGHVHVGLRPASGRRWPPDRGRRCRCGCECISGAGCKRYVTAHFWGCCLPAF